MFLYGTYLEPLKTYFNDQNPEILKKIRIQYLVRIAVLVIFKNKIVFPKLSW